jgi:hypothetical protein
MAGRKPLPPDRKRSVRILVQLTPGDAEAVAARAAGAGLTIAEYCWRVLIRDRPAVVPRVNREAWRRLAPVAGNLNQALRHANVSAIAGRDPDLRALPALIREVRAALAALRAGLLGEVADETQH